MKIKSANWIYILAIVPLLIVDLGLGIWLARNKLWLVVLLAVLGVAMVVAVFRKFLVMPKPMENYGAYREAELELPVEANVKLYWSDEMAKFEFLHRIVEVVTTLIPDKGPIKVMMNPAMEEAYGENFMRMAVTRELESLRTRTNLKSMIGLVLPIEVLAGCLMGVACVHLQLEEMLGGFAVNMVGPFLALALFGVSLFFWNKNISKQDIRLDRYMLAHFSKEEVEEYICITEKMIEGGGREKEFSEHYKNDRLFALRNYKNN